MGAGSGMDGYPLSYFEYPYDMYESSSLLIIFAKTSFFSVVIVGLRMMINKRQQQKRRKMETEKMEGRKKKVVAVVQQLPLLRMSQKEEGEGKRKTRVRMKPCRWTPQLPTTMMLPRQPGQPLRRVAVKTVTREMINFH